MQRLFCIFSFLCIFNLSHAQNISGTWTGNYADFPQGIIPQKVVVDIFVYNDSLITGTSHLYYGDDTYEHYKIKGIYRKKTHHAFFAEDSTIAVKLGFSIGNCLGNYFMKVYPGDTVLSMYGVWRDNFRTMSRCGTGKVWLKKKIEKKIIPAPPVKKMPVQKTPPVVPVIKKTPPQTPVTPPVKIPERVPAQIPVKVPEKTYERAPDKLANRIPDVQSLIEVKYADKDSIKIEVYDNGEIDNDSVSIIFNDRLLVNKKMISLKPITFYVALSKSDPISKIKMVAESLGTIPPCTAVMIVTTKSKRYEVHLSSNFSKNGTLELFLKE